MISPNRRTLRWLLAALLLPIMLQPLSADQTTSTPPSGTPSGSSPSTCEATCNLELTKLAESCKHLLTNTSTPHSTPTFPSLTPSSQVSARTCTNDCDQSLQALRLTLGQRCQEATDDAVASERRHYEPMVAQLTTERDDWKDEAEGSYAVAALWRHAGATGIGIGAGCAAGALLADDALTILGACAGGGVAGLVSSFLFGW